QTGDRVAEVFKLPFRVDFRLDDGSTTSMTLELNQKEQAFYIPLASKPKFVRVDGEILKTLDLERPVDVLAAQLEGDDNVMGRIDAARALGKKGDKDSIAALAKAVREDAFWGVQAE